MNIQPDNTTTNISDDQELAKALAGVNDTQIQFEDPAQEAAEPEQTTPEPAVPAPAPLPINPVPSRDNLEDVKMEAINELRPLIDKLTLPAEEKFDVYLLLIRCTDDKELVAPAHAVAKQIEDESRRAMALLDIIKEIDYLANKTNSPSGDQVTATAPVNTGINPA
jgi:hypothetical protein